MLLSASGCGITKGIIPAKAIDVISTIAKNKTKNNKKKQQLNKHDCI